MSCWCCWRCSARPSSSTAPSRRSWSSWCPPTRLRTHRNSRRRKTRLGPAGRAERAAAAARATCAEASCRTDAVGAGQQPAGAAQAADAKSEGPAAPSAPPDSKPSIFDPAAIPLLLDLPNLQGRDFDAESTTIAKLSDDERATFRARLRRCWKLPGAASLNQGTRVVLRIYLRRDATLAGDPVLIEASASRDGPAVMQAAMRALKDCQPFAFLPADKYREWKVLDLSFTPRDMAGG
jgi:hypothetical protein